MTDVRAALDSVLERTHALAKRMDDCAAMDASEWEEAARDFAREGRSEKELIRELERGRVSEMEYQRALQAYAKEKREMRKGR